MLEDERPAVVTAHAGGLCGKEIPSNGFIQPFGDHKLLRLLGSK